MSAPVRFRDPRRQTLGRPEPISAAIYAKTLGDLFDRLDDLDLDLPDVRAAYDRHRELVAYQHAQVGSAEHLARRLQADLASGAVTLEDAVDQLEAVQRAADRQSVAAGIVRGAAGEAAHQAWRLLEAHGDSLIDDLLDPALQQRIEQARKLAPGIPAGVDDDETAMNAGGKVPATWSRLRVLAGEVAATHAVADLLRSWCVLSAPHDVDVLPLAMYRYRRTDLLPPEALPSPAADLLACLDASPAVLRTDELAEVIPVGAVLRVHQLPPGTRFVPRFTPDEAA